MTKRLFVTTDGDKANIMYAQIDDDITEFVQNMVTKLPLSLDGNDGSKIILINDKFTNWEKYNVNRDTDFILYHRSSEKSVIANIESVFTYRIDGSHILDADHDKVFQFLKSGNQNFSELIDKLFPYVEIKGTDGSPALKIYKSIACEAYRQLYKALTLSYIREKRESAISVDTKDVNAKLLEVNKYFVDSDIKIPASASIHEIYQYLKLNHSAIEKQLFG